MGESTDRKYDASFVGSCDFYSVSVDSIKVSFCITKSSPFYNHIIIIHNGKKCYICTTIIYMLHLDYC